MVDQREALAVSTDLLTRFIWYALPGFEPSTLGSVINAVIRISALQIPSHAICVKLINPLINKTDEEGLHIILIYTLYYAYKRLFCAYICKLIPLIETQMIFNNYPTINQPLI